MTVCSTCSVHLNESRLSLCSSCADLQVSQLQQQLTLLHKSIRTCQQFMTSELTNAGEFDSESIDQLNQEYNALTKERHSLESTLKDLEIEHEALLLQEEELKKREQEHFVEYNIHQEELFQFKKHRHSLNAKVTKASEQFSYLQTLMDQGVLKDIFKIVDISGFASLIGCRMGACTTTDDWLETNAATGYCALLFNVIAHKLNLKFTKWEIQALGSYSRLINIEDKKSYPLYYQTETFAMLFFQRQNYNRALVGLLECLLEIEHAASLRDDRFTVPYKIQKDMINNLTIQCTFDDKWAKACKCFLTNVKWVVSWIA
eukprot:NODE_15_length_42055_cov_0.634117.p12 type:complete len:317 gc:universal NODE_15_length_42055_cov_0.634117:24160-23210(-)